jgi:hypothetical protein
MSMPPSGSVPPSGWSHNAQRLWQAMSDGQMLDLTPDGQPGKAAADCSVSAEVLAHLMVRPPETGSGLVQRLRLRGAHIEGKLVLAVTGLVTSSISLFRAEIGGNLRFNTARLDGGGSDWAINGAQLRVEGGSSTKGKRHSDQGKLADHRLDPRLGNRWAASAAQSSREPRGKGGAASICRHGPSSPGTATG